MQVLWKWHLHRRQHCVIRYAKASAGTNVQWDLFLWGYVKSALFVPSLAADIPDLKWCVTRDMLVKVWEEMEYQMDICCDSCHSHCVSPKFAWNLDRFSISLYVLQESDMDGLISMTSWKYLIWITLY
jgi:hypothetical protein